MLDVIDKYSVEIGLDNSHLKAYFAREGVPVTRITRKLIKLISEFVGYSSGYDKLAVRLYLDYIVYNNQKPVFKTYLQELSASNKFDAKFMNQILKLDLEYMINLDNDCLFTFNGLITFLGLYKPKVSCVFSPQFIFLQTALRIIWLEGVDYYWLSQSQILYNKLSNFELTFATAVLTNILLDQKQLSSCYIFGFNTNPTQNDVLDVIHDTQRVLVNTGGVGTCLSNLPSIASSEVNIKSVSRILNGIPKQLNVIKHNSARTAVSAFWLDILHPDSLVLLDMADAKSQHFASSSVCGFVLHDEFMRRVKANKNWYFFTVQHLYTLYDDEFVDDYNFTPDSIKHKFTYHYRKMIDSLPPGGGKFIPAREFMQAIVNRIRLSGAPFMSMKDAANRYSNQVTLSTKEIIQCPNLCTEIYQKISNNYYGVCNIATVDLVSCIIDNKFNFNKLQEDVRLLVRYLNIIIDRASYFNMRKAYDSVHDFRALGIGVRGLTTTYQLLGIPYEDARELNFRIFENMYYAAMLQSVLLAKQYGFYRQYPNSKTFSDHKFLFERYPKNDGLPFSLSLDWEELRNSIRAYGMYNSDLIALAPTAINCKTYRPVSPSIEIDKYLIQKQETLGFRSLQISHGLTTILNKNNIYNKDIIDAIILNKGSLQNIKEIPENIRNLFKTAFEIHPHVQALHAADRHVFVDQGQSFNLFIPTTFTTTNIFEFYMYQWRLQAKTLSYYTHIMVVADARICTKNNRECVACEA